MEIYGYHVDRESDLQHYGILGMKWGVRRWQNADGTFKQSGKNRYFGKGTGENYHPVTKGAPPVSSTSSSQKQNSFDKEKAKKIAKGVAIGAAVVGGTILVAYGGYKVHQAGGFRNVGKDLVQKVNDIKVDTVSKAQQFKVDIAKSNYDMATSDKAKETYKNTAKAVGKAAKATKEGVKTAASIAKSSAEVAKLAAQHPQETKAAMDYTAQLLRNLGELSAANSRNSATASRSSASDTYTRNQAVREYRRQHPNTKLTDSQIASNFGL